MPKEFTDCVKNGGKVRTIIVNKKKGIYMHVCYDKEGKAHPGETHTKKKTKAEIENLISDLKELERYWNDRYNQEKTE